MSFSDRDSPDDTEQISLDSLVCTDTVIAVMSDARALEDYFLLHVTSNGCIILEQEQTSDYGHVFPQGTTVFIGNFYLHQKTTKEGLIYKKDSKVAITHKDSILYAGLELAKKRNKPDLYILSSNDHEDILYSISVCI